MYQRHLLFISLILCCFSVVAQNKGKHTGCHFMSNVDSILDAHTKMRVDTNYIAHPEKNWTLLVRGRVYEKFILIRGNTAGIGDYVTKIYAPMKNTLGISVSYRGLSLSLDVNLKDPFGKNTGRDYNLSYYNNLYGADLSYSNTDNLSTTVSVGEETKGVKLTDSRLKQLSASAYYVLNGRKFSYPAAFTHSYIQRRSAGSFLVSAGFYMGHFDSSIDDKTGYFSTDKRISMKHISIGGGYAYNYVPDKHWLLHASLVPHVIVWHDCNYSVTLDTDTNLPLEKKIPYRFPCIQGTGRFALKYNWNYFFTGFNSVVQSALIGVGNKEMSAGNTQWKVEVFVGLRL